ncbi:MAG: AbrB/MazE/SpoVT family DNA-binding domain-containing protein [Clostridia bacterium]|jgi:transcriptional pleiotropic regulator of transition state genes|nr:AbrB/MazE/SpoVT family DNA-binding domain-containing protein [Clostridia bacterium]
MHRSIGIVRALDQMGRITLPEELRNHFNINHDDEVEIYTEDESIVLMKYSPVCLICGSAVDLVELKDNYVCRECIKGTKAV